MNHDDKGSERLGGLEGPSERDTGVYHIYIKREKEMREGIPRQDPFQPVIESVIKKETKGTATEGEIDAEVKLSQALPL